MADSLRVNHSVTCDDSLALAGAFTTMGRWRLIYPDDYARACYYYGRMLRNRGDQVAAMRAFVCGTHAPYVRRLVPLPWFTDYHILGRIYTNMGTMCHLVDEFELGYDMYKYSAESFRKACDTTAYYYGLNAMALELAEQKLHNETLFLLSQIETRCTDQNILTKTWETKAILYQNMALYDSAIYSIRQLYDNGYCAATGYVTAAQAFWCLQQYDSALYYAQQVMRHPNAAIQDRYHMLYLLINHDSIIDKQDVRTLSSERADLDCEVIEPLLQQLSVAIELLRQDVGKAPSSQKIIVFLVISFLVVVTIWFVIAKLRGKITHLLNRRQQLVKENDDIRRSSEDMKHLYSAREQQIVQDIENTCEIIRQYNNWDQELHWKDYYALCDFINHHFYLLADKLRYIYHLDEKEMRLSILVLLDMFNNDTLAKILHYGKGIRTYKSRINTKLGNKGQDLRSKLIQIAVSPSKSSA